MLNILLGLGELFKIAKIIIILVYVFILLKLMAWGFWNKIKKGFKKAGKVFKKGAQFINDKVIKPYKPIIKEGLNKWKPGAGNVVDIASGAVDVITGDNPIGGISSWAKQKFK